MFDPLKADPTSCCMVPMEWAKFFASLLLSPEHFDCAKGFLQNKRLMTALLEGEGVNLALPSNCPLQKAPSCALVEAEPDVDFIDLSEAPPLDEDTDSNKSKSAVKKASKKKKVILVESEVRRSLRTKGIRKGFKDPVCMGKFCLGCNSKPPTLSNKTIRKLSSTLCDIDASQVTDESLMKLKKAGAPSPKKKNVGSSRKKKVASLVVDGDTPRTSEDDADDYDD